MLFFQSLSLPIANQSFDMQSICRFREAVLLEIPISWIKKEMPMLEYLRIRSFVIRSIKGDSLFANTLDLQQTTSIVAFMVYTVVYTTCLNRRIIVVKRHKKRESHFCNSLFQWCHHESNEGHKDFQSFALPTELWHHLSLFDGAKISTNFNKTIAKLNFTSN